MKFKARTPEETKEWQKQARLKLFEIMMGGKKPDKAQMNPILIKLEENFDFSDIFACVAPRYLITQIGLQEKAPGGFPIAIAKEAFREIQEAYRVFEAEDRCLLDIHDGGHVFVAEKPMEWFKLGLQAYKLFLKVLCFSSDIYKSRLFIYLILKNATG